MATETEEEIKENAIEENLPWVSRFDETVHTTCCADWSTMLCGLIDPNAKPPMDDPPGDKCNVCDYLRETDFCPNGFVCSQMQRDY